jgi:N-acetylmuramic acid 6-phosphate etherase
VGAGTSGRLGVLDAAECPPTFGTPPEQVVGIIAGGPEALVRSVEGAEDDPGAGAAAMDAHQVGSRDTVVGIATSGTTPYVRGALTRARELGARTVFLTCVEAPSGGVEDCDVTIAVLTGPEVVTGSTRMKAGTATKLVLNTLTTGAMVRLGKTYGNLMVDLQARNQKLVDRGERIVMAVTAASREAARRAIRDAGGSVRTAIVMIRRGVSRAEAEALLRSHDNHLRPILGDPPPVGPE